MLPSPMGTARLFTVGPLLCCQRAVEGVWGEEPPNLEGLSLGPAISPDPQSLSVSGGSALL